MTFLLDTNTCISVLRGMPSVMARLRSCRPDDCAVSVVTLYELLTGAERCRKAQAERSKVLALVAPIHLLPYDEWAADRSAAIRWMLEKNGTPIGPYDLLLAGQALSLDLTLVSHNLREFSRVPGLRVVSWE